MNTINITNARKNLFQLVSDVNKGFNPVNIINNKGENAILLSESDWRDIEETIYLNSIPGFDLSMMLGKKIKIIALFIKKVKNGRIQNNIF